jgi:hypothetical protein
VGDSARHWQQELAFRWSELDTSRTGHSTVTQRLGIVVNAGDVLIGIDPHGDHQLLVPVPGDAEVLEDAHTAHIRVTGRRLTFDGLVHTYVAVVCHRRDLADLFDDILADILNELSETDDQADLVCKRTLDRWRELLRGNRDRMGESEVWGLFGELIVLERILEADPGHDLSAWTGPDREPHDFRLARGDLEVKTLGIRGAEIEIHGLDQLEPPEGGKLHLVLVRLAMAPNGVTLPELVERIKPKIGDPTAFGVKMEKVGYRDAEAHNYQNRRFKIGDIAGIEVDRDFPRITKSSLVGGLPEEVTTLTYTLDISTSLTGALTADRLDTLFERGE